MDNTDKLRSKLFSFGLYGRPAAALSDAELAAALRAPYVEAVPASTANKLRTAFTLEPHASEDIRRTVPPDYVVRMCTLAWREYIFGPGVNIVSKEYFYLIDFLLGRQDYASAAEIRTALGIEPKTYHYICKKLKELGIICEMREGAPASIKLNAIADRSADAKTTSFEEELFRQADDLDPQNLVLLVNLPFLEQVKLMIARSTSGMDAKSLYQTTGLRPKTGLKIMQRIATQQSSDFCMVAEMCYKSSTCKIYSRSAYEQVTEARMARISTRTAVGGQDTISAEEKAAAMRFIAEKHGSFVLGKDIVKQLSEITGWAYTFDRKTLLNTAESAGLHITKSVIGSNKRYIISLQSLEQASESQIEVAQKTGCAERSKRRLKSLFLLNSSQVKLDNGSARNVWLAYKELLEYLSSLLKDAQEYGISLSDIVARMPSGLFFSLSSLIRPCLRYNAAFNAWRNNPGHFSAFQGDLGKSHSIFYIENCMEFIKPAVFELAKCADALPMDVYLSLLSERYATILKAKLESKSMRTALNRLWKEGFIEIAKRDGLLYIKRGALRADDPRIDILVGGAQTRPHVDYNTRERIYSNICQLDPNLSDAGLQAFIRDNYPEEIAEALGAAFAAPAENNRTKRGTIRVTALPEYLQGLYLKIKEALVEGHAGDFGSFRGYKSSDIETVFKYLMHRRIINARRVSEHLPSVPLNQKFTRMFAQHPTFYKGFAHAGESYHRIYFYRIYKLVSSSGSIDTNAILERLVFIEDFELMKFFEIFRNVFQLQNIDGFTFVSLLCTEDPFQGD